MCENHSPPRIHNHAAVEAFERFGSITDAFYLQEFSVAHLLSHFHTWELQSRPGRDVEGQKLLSGTRCGNKRVALTQEPKICFSHSRQNPV